MCRSGLGEKAIKSDCLKNMCGSVSRFWEGQEIADSAQNIHASYRDSMTIDEPQCRLMLKRV